MNKTKVASLVSLVAFLIATSFAVAQSRWSVMDMVHNNPGEAPTKTEFLSPDTLLSYGYDSKVFFLFEAAQFGVDWSCLNSDIMPVGSDEYKWMQAKREIISRKYSEAHDAGLKVYCMLDMMVLPKRLVSIYADSILNEKGKIDINRPFTQKCVRLLMQQMFMQFPLLDGLIIRTGETYLQDAPYYQGNNPVQSNFVTDHVTLINILRDEVCEKLNRKLFYRTWDFGQFHSLPKWYLAITEQIAPHENLFFSIKHTMTDFWRGAIDSGGNIDSRDSYWIYETSKHGNPFNPTIGIGRHKQIVEVQCSREYEGKSSHVNYIAAGVIDGFPEYTKFPSYGEGLGVGLTSFEKEGYLPHPFCLRDLKDNPLVQGIWTWTRGGGWGGPYIANEFWVELNAYVLAHWADNRECSEEEIFTEFALKKGLRRCDVKKFHRLCMLSLDGVMMGQYSYYGGTWINWTRDNSAFDRTQIGFMKEIWKSGRAELYSREKHQAVKIWQKIERLSKQIRFSDETLNTYVRQTCTYAFLKYTFFAYAWDAMMSLAIKEETGTLPPQASRQVALANQYLKAWNDYIEANNLQSLTYNTSQWQSIVDSLQ